MDIDYSKIPENLRFPRTLNYNVWREYLGRPLEFEEKYMLENYKSEKHMNDMMSELYVQCNKKGDLYVPMLTNMDGNCMFESLIYHGIGSSVMQLRTILSVLLYIYKDYKGFLPKVDASLNEMFLMTNEVEYVVLRKKLGNDETRNYYKYTYNVMCQDISNNHSWSRLPTQLILTTISYLYKVEIIIISNLSEYENKINAYESCIIKPQIKTIYLGHLGECHYVPIDTFNISEEIIDPLFYRDAKIKLHQWAEEMEVNKINTYYDELVKQQKKDEEMKLEINNNINTDNIPSAYVDLSVSGTDSNIPDLVNF